MCSLLKPTYPLSFPTQEYISNTLALLVWDSLLLLDGIAHLCSNPVCAVFIAEFSDYGVPEREEGSNSEGAT